jgi:hypothetical protein
MAREQVYEECCVAFRGEDMRDEHLLLISSVLLLLLVLSPSLAAEGSGGLVDVTLTVVQENCSGYATFQSHNQKVVSNENGIFMTYLWEFDMDTWIGRWRLARSVDGGETFSTVFTSPPMGSNAPCIETDRKNDILLICTNYTHFSMPFYFYRFEAKKDYQDPFFRTINTGASGKFSMFLDEESNLLYLFNHYGKLFVRNATTGGYVREREVMEFSGENATTQYPHVFVSEDGILHHAWTTSYKERYLYWDIHYAKSPNRGVTWYTAAGKKLPSGFLPDHAGPADQIILPDEFEYHTWLSNMIVKDGKVHFAYLAQVPGQPRQHYVRMDLETGAIDRRIQPSFRGETIELRGLDGFFATGPGSAPLYYVGAANGTHIGALVSHDNGDTWHDAAISEPLSKAIYSVGGCRELTPEGIIGSFTASYGSRGDPHFIRMPVPESHIALLLVGLLLSPSALGRRMARIVRQAHSLGHREGTVAA